MRPDVDVLYQKPRREAKDFKIHSNEVKIYYEKAKIGETYVGKMLPELSEALGVPRLTNAQVRPNVIRKMKAAKIEDRTLMSLTGHKKVETLRHYDPAPDNSKKLEMSMAIFAKKKSKTVKLAKPSSTMTSGQMDLQTPQVVVAEVHKEENSPNKK